MLLVIDCRLGSPGLSPFLVIGRLQRVNLEPHGGELRFGLIYRNLEWARVKPKQQLACANFLIVFDVDFDDPPGNIGADRDIGVVGRDVTTAGQVPVGCRQQNEDRPREHQRQAQSLA